MERIIDHFLNSPDQLIGLILLIITFLFFGINAHIRRVALWDAITGPDHKLQLPEVVMAIWIILFPIMVLSNLFLGFIPDKSIVFSMDIILAVILGAKKYKDASLIAGKSRKEREKDESSEDQQ